MPNTKKKAQSLQVNDSATLSHETAKSKTGKVSPYFLEDLLEQLRFSTPERRLKENYYEKYISHEFSALQESFKRSKIPTLSDAFLSWTLQRTKGIRRIQACYKADLLMMKITNPSVDYRSITFEELLSKSNDLHTSMLIAKIS